jgi:hypothetical protein
MGANQMRRNGEDQEQAIRPEFNRSIMMDFRCIKLPLDTIPQGGGLSMLRQRYLWPITIGPHFGEHTRSTSPLTEGSRVEYVQILKKGSLIWHKSGNWSRWTIFGRATAIGGSKSIAELVLGQNDRHL